MQFAIIVILVIMNIVQIFRNGVHESRFVKVQAAVNKALENARPNNQGKVLDELVNDICNALY